MTYDWLEREGYSDEIIEPVDVRFLCESQSIYLKPNHIYKFKVDFNCDKCKELNVYGDVP
jgi:hypothetical protein